MAKVGDNSGLDAEWGRVQTLLLKRAVAPENPNQDVKERYRAVCCAVGGEESAFQPDWVMQLKQVPAPAFVPLFGSIELGDDEYVNFRLIRNVGNSEWLVFKTVGPKQRLPNALAQIQKFSELLSETDEFVTSAQLNQLDNLAAQYPPSDEVGRLWKQFKTEPKSPEVAKALLARVSTLLDQGVTIYERFGEILAKGQLRVVGMKARGMSKPEAAVPVGGKFSHHVKKGEKEKATRDMLVCNMQYMRLPDAVEKLIETFRSFYGVNLERPDIPKDLQDRLIEDLTLEFEKSNDVWKMLGAEANFRYERRLGKVHFIDTAGMKKK